MANVNGVWGIDIGQCGLKALRCTLADDGETVKAEAFDYIQYPKILSQPEADPIELVREALDQFLSRNETRGDQVAISVSGQSGLARFFKPPPVDAKLIPNIVKYEAGQQIPFALEDVIWDYQQIGGTEVDGFTLDAEIGLFAMKREQVFRAIQPFMSAGVELHHVQLSPLCVYNFICHEILNDVPEPEEIDPENPPESLVVLAIGTETTDLVITNGTQLWQRSIPLGGNHFTKQLTKEMKLTFAKAEHLKRNAREAKDPKAVFQAMRPVFNDLATEIQRSLGYFQSIDRQAKIGRMVVLGNTTKLPGLKQYLAKNLGQEIIEVKSFSKIQGKSILSASTFKDNALSFVVSYGLCLQGLDLAKISTNLLPPEFFTERLIREKKPWAVATVGVFLLALMINYFFYYSSWWKVNDARTSKDAGGQDVSWSDAVREMDRAGQESQNLLSADTALVESNKKTNEVGDEIVESSERKLVWLILLKAIGVVLPRDAESESSTDESPPTFIDRKEMQINHIESKYFADLKQWFTPAVQKRYREQQIRDKEEGQGEELSSAPDNSNAENPNPPDTENPTNTSSPEGPGWIIEIEGYHFHNSDPNIKDGWGPSYVRNTLMNNLQKATVKLRLQPDEDPEDFTMAELGIDFVILAYGSKINHNYKIRAPGQDGANSVDGGAGVGGKPDEKSKPVFYKAPRCDFAIQFCWKDQTLIEELKKRIELQKNTKKPKKTAVRESVASKQAGGS